MTDWLSTKIVKDLKPARPLIARSLKGTIYTQLNDSTYDWENSQPGRAGFGTIHLDPNSGGPWGTYTVNGGSSVSDKEKRLNEDALLDHLWNINNLKFEEEKPLTWEELKKSFSDWAREKGWIKADGSKVLKDLTGALVFPKGETIYISPQGRQSILNKKLEGKQLPQGSVVKQTVNGLPGDLNNFGEQQAGQTGYSRIIKYGATPMQNDTVYTRTNPYGLGFENTPEGNKQGFNSLYYKKQGGRLMRQGGKIIEVTFE